MELVRPGQVGPEVADVQRRLASAGHPCEADDPGVFGQATTAAVRAFQQQRGLAATGVVGEDTWRALVEAGYRLGDRLLYLTRPPLRGDDVRDLQRRLNRLGFDTGFLDGAYGRRTQEAVRDFQLNMGLSPDAIAGPATVSAVCGLHRHHQSAAAFAVREREALRRPGRASVAGARIMVDAGRGPQDPGVVREGGLAEHRITWQIANRVAGRLAALSAQVVHARGPLTTPSALARADLANRAGVEVILSVHCNAAPSPRARGVAGYHFGHGGTVSERGRRLAELAVDRVVAATGTVDCRTHPSMATLLQASRAPAAQVEVGFLTHLEEGRLLADPSYQDRLASALTDALVSFVTGRNPLAAMVS